MVLKKNQYFSSFDYLRPDQLGNNYPVLDDPRWPCNMKSKSVSYQRAGAPSVRGCHGHRHLYVNRSRVGRPETARTCPEVSNKKNETHHQIRATLFIDSVGTHERKHKC